MASGAFQIIATSREPYSKDQFKFINVKSKPKNKPSNIKLLTKLKAKISSNQRLKHKFTEEFAEHLLLHKKKQNYFFKYRQNNWQNSSSPIYNII